MVTKSNDGQLVYVIEFTVAVILDNRTLLTVVVIIMNQDIQSS